MQDGSGGRIGFSFGEASVMVPDSQQPLFASGNAEVCTRPILLHIGLTLRIFLPPFLSTYFPRTSCPLLLYCGFIISTILGTILPDFAYRMQ